jgi:hypothetical protein
MSAKKQYFTVNFIHLLHKEKSDSTYLFQSVLLSPFSQSVHSYSTHTHTPNIPIGGGGGGGEKQYKFRIDVIESMLSVTVHGTKRKKRDQIIKKRAS